MKTIYCEKEEDWAGTLREVEFLRKQRHPCIIDVCDCFILSHPRVLHILMQYCETGDLGKVISNAQKSNGNIPEGNILKWVYQIALALHYIHENGYDYIKYIFIHHSYSLILYLLNI
jgi:NIMA (never in mitosis gene a)-related kinase